MKVLSYIYVYMFIFIYTHEQRYIHTVLFAAWLAAPSQTFRELYSSAAATPQESPSNQRLLFGV